MKLPVKKVVVSSAYSPFMNQYSILEWVAILFLILCLVALKGTRDLVFKKPEIVYVTQTLEIIREVQKKK